MDKDTKDFLITAGSIATSIWILKKIFEGYYKCPNCNYPVDQSMHVCPNCGQPLIWNNLR